MFDKSDLLKTAEKNTRVEVGRGVVTITATQGKDVETLTLSDHEGMILYGQLGVLYQNRRQVRWPGHC